MVKRCSHGLCKSDDRYPERLDGGVRFIPFPKPKSNSEKCLRWIKLCGRPYSQLNPSRINSNRYVCSKHFLNGIPSEEFPDPLPADPSSRMTLTRKPPMKRNFTDMTSPVAALEQCEDILSSDLGEGEAVEERTNASCGTQTTANWVEPMDLMGLAVENEMMKRELAKTTLEQVETTRLLEEKKVESENLKKLKTVTFTVESILEEDNLIHYYTGYPKEMFLAILKFLIPCEDNHQCPLSYIGKGNLSQIKNVSLKNQLFLTLCRLRNNFDLQDLALRFGLTQQVIGVIFNSWINYMFLRFGEVPIWPHRDVLYENMPEDYKSEFPTTFVIVDCTEIKIQKPSSLKAQSQTYSDYKSSNTLKALVAVDPRGSVLFSSMLFAGAMSDKEIFKRSGFQSTLTNFVNKGYLKCGDGIMADKGFDIVKEVEETGLKLNIPPFAKSGVQMNQHDVFLTQKIAKHRVHVERSIRRIKSFKILSGRIPLSLMSSIDQIWFVCSFLTNFMPPCIRRK